MFLAKRSTVIPVRSTWTQLLARRRGGVDLLAKNVVLVLPLQVKLSWHFEFRPWIQVQVMWIKNVTSVSTDTGWNFNFEQTVPLSPRIVCWALLDEGASTHFDVLMCALHLKIPESAPPMTVCWVELPSITNRKQGYTQTWVSSKAIILSQTLWNWLSTSHSPGGV